MCWPKRLAHGLPAVGYAGCGGVADLIEHEVNGLLAGGNGDVETLQQQLQFMMNHDDKRAAMGKKAVETMAPYRPEKIYDLWEDFLQESIS